MEEHLCYCTNASETDDVLISLVTLLCSKKICLALQIQILVLWCPKHHTVHPEGENSLCKLALQYQNHTASLAFVHTAWVHVVSVSSVLADSLRGSSVSWNQLRIVGSQGKKDSLGINRINGIWENVKNLFRHQLIASVWSI